MRRSTVLPGTQPLPADPAIGRHPTEEPRTLPRSSRPAVIAVSPRPGATIIKVHDEDDVDEALERLRVELEALAYSSELI